MTYTYTPGLTFSSGEDASGTKINELLQNVVAIFPVGALVYFHQTPTTTETTLNGKWIQCNGTAISRTTYAALWAQFGSSDVYGGGNGTTTFGLPDLRGRIPVSVATSGHADVNAFGDNDGAALASRRLKHAHTFSNGGGHSHTVVGISLASGGDHSHNHSYPVVGGVAEQSGSDDDMITGNGGLLGSLSGFGGSVHAHTLSSGGGPNSATAVSQVGIAGTTTDQPGFIVAGSWYMAYV